MMNAALDSVQPMSPAVQTQRRRLGLREELLLALAPTVVVLIVFALVEELTHQRLLFASLAASAFLIYLDPEHGTNNVRMLAVAQMMAALIGFLAFTGLGSTYSAGGVAMVTTIFLMNVMDVVHPPAVATSLSFAFRAKDESNLILFGLAVVITVLLVLLQRFVLWLLIHLRSRQAKSVDRSHILPKQKCCL